MPKLVAQTPTRWKVRLDCGHLVTLEMLPDNLNHEIYCHLCTIYARKKREAEFKEIDDALRGVTQELRRRGVKAEYYHSGGGCMVVRCPVSDTYDWCFGLADVCWGGDFSSDHDGYLFSVESSYPAHTKYETVADWIWSFLSLPGFVDHKSGIYVRDAYRDPTGRFDVDPWEAYGIPYPATWSSQDTIGVIPCDNCTERFRPATPNMICTRCQQPNPANQD